MKGFEEICHLLKMNHSGHCAESRQGTCVVSEEGGCQGQKQDYQIRNFLGEI